MPDKRTGFLSGRHSEPAFLQKSICMSWLVLPPENITNDAGKLGYDPIYDVDLSDISKCP